MSAVMQPLPPPDPAESRARIHSVRVALVQMVNHWRRDLETARFHLNAALEADDGFAVELYTISIEELSAGIRHLGEHLDTLEG